jgi:hypothetical protein
MDFPRTPRVEVIDGDRQTRCEKKDARHSIDSRHLHQNQANAKQCLVARPFLSHNDCCVLLPNTPSCILFALIQASVSDVLTIFDCSNKKQHEEALFSLPALVLAVGPPL